jgi:hypothetical protein
MGEKVSFDEINKIINITLAPDANDDIFIDVKTDLYSDGKEDWVSSENLRKFRFPITAVGGNPLPGSKELGSTFFLASDWKIKPYSASHRLTINGNLYSQDGSDPFLDPDGTYTVRIMQQVSSLVDSTVSQLAEIEYASFNGGVTVDVDSPYSIASPPTDGTILGTPRSPVNNLSDALDIAVERGFNLFYILGDITVGDGLDFTQITFVGESIDKTEITIDSDANVSQCEFYESTIKGTLDGQCKVKECRILDVNYISGVVELCILSGEITLGGGAEAYFLDCWAGTNLGIPPSIDLGGSGQTLVMQNFNGYMSWKNKNGISDQANASLNAGWIVLESTITAGNITIIGTGHVEDYSTGSTAVNIDHLVNPDNVASHVWMHSSALELLGLVQKNYKMDNQIYQDYNGAKLLTSARIRTYVDNTMAVVLATYLVTATWSNGACTSYQMVRV